VVAVFIGAEYINDSAFFVSFIFFSAKITLRSTLTEEIEFAALFWGHRIKKASKNKAFFDIFSKNFFL
jgi:hypothetical protein